MFTIYAMFSHLISDFILQSNKIVNLKANINLKGYLKHSWVLFVTMMPLLFIIKASSYKVFIYKVVLIVILHILTDFIKEKIQNTIKNKDYFHEGKVILFLIDQIIHIFIIIVITRDVILEYNTLNEWIKSRIFNGNGITFEGLKKVVVIMYISFSGAYIIPLILDMIYKNIDNYTSILNKIVKIDISDNEKHFIDEVKTGKWIGILERILILIFLYLNQISSIGFVIAVKSLARFKMMENKIFAEYYLLGTLISVAYTFVAYAFFQLIL